MANQIMAIAPYWLDEIETWVFDDPGVDLVQEPFVSGVPELIGWPLATRRWPESP